MASSLTQTPRSDARDNRERILVAARAVFAAKGLDVPMREVARRAGVGPATLYRHFPTKQALATEAFTEQMQACLNIVEEGAANPDPWRGLRFVIEELCELHARCRGFAAAFAAAFPGALDLAARRAQALTSLAELARRAKATGQLSPDFTLDDLVLVLRANGGLDAMSINARVAASRRFAALAIRAFQA
ncbi:TetR family transcriptional regulator [Asanoa ishikariensis]|uniref:Transcriptional regulator, TetR family n=1 Tax=Asanoa ishikariensis TaxID=137265 RepID=A0A1H3R3I2_9ACTN|nr:TetR/AcrR family transcriptional regulator [Asanoa ishikariensis]GIF64453.1 TetR family transcriptional regulator [Asanoa ishikariensis]SDZ20190.1 transcriptional regulator, TetR family [Asanoa ishikariensis]